MNPGQRLALNTTATYARSLLSTALTLFSSRWVLEALGQSDFGLFNVVGSLVVFITFLNTVMASSASRHFSLAIGKGESGDVRRWFNTALSIHLCLGGALALIGWPVGEYLIHRVLTVPPDRLAASLWVFRVSLFSAFATMATVPFVALFTSKQRIFELAFWGALQALLVFALAASLGRAPGDKLLFYGVGMVAITLLTQGAQALRAQALFPECRLEPEAWFDPARFKEILSFAAWNFVGNVGLLLRNQGSALLLNVFFGPVVNAAYGIATQVANSTNQLSWALNGAFAPEVTASEGRGDRARVLSLSQRANKLGTLLVVLFLIPLLFETEEVLRLWLKTPPPYTAALCRFILIAFLLDRMTSGSALAVNAKGRIAAYQTTLGLLLVLTVPLAWCAFRAGWPPTSLGVLFVVTMAACTVARVYWMSRSFGVPAWEWGTRVLAPCLITAAVAFLAGGIFHFGMGPSVTRVLWVTAASCSAALWAIWRLALDPREKEFLMTHAGTLLRRLGIRLGGRDDLGEGHP